jgi:heat shock protein HslJ
MPVLISSADIIPNRGAAFTGAACAGGAGAQDNWIAQFFAHSVRYQLKGDVLTLTSGSKALQLTAAGSDSARSSYDR